MSKKVHSALQSQRVTFKTWELGQGAVALTRHPLRFQVLYQWHYLKSCPKHPGLGAEEKTGWIAQKPLRMKPTVLHEKNLSACTSAHPLSCVFLEHQEAGRAKADKACGRKNENSGITEACNELHLPWFWNPGELLISPSLRNEITNVETHSKQVILKEG